MSDFIIHCQGHTWRVHRLIISNGCEFFHKLCTGNFKVDCSLSRRDTVLIDKQEAIERSVDLPDDDPKIVARLLLFLYTGGYPVHLTEEWHRLNNENYYAYRKQLASVIRCNDNEDEIPTSSLCVEAAVHGIAEKYVVPRLKELSAEAYQECMDAKWNKRCPETIAEFIRSIKIVYNTTKPSDRLRDFVVWQTQIDYLTTVHFRAFQELFTSNGDFAWDLVAKGKAKQWVWCNRCKGNVQLRHFERYCLCGMMGFCYESDVCGNWEKLMCTDCYKVGQCQSEPPRAKQLVEVQGISCTEQSDID